MTFAAPTGRLAALAALAGVLAIGCGPDDRFEGRDNVGVGNISGRSVEPDPPEQDGPDNPDFPDDPFQDPQGAPLPPTSVVVEAFFEGYMPVIGDFVAGAPQIGAWLDPTYSAVSLTDSDFGWETLLGLDWPGGDLTQLEPGTYNTLGVTFVGCSGQGNGFEWDDNTPNGEIVVTNDPDSPDRRRVDFTVTFSSGPTTQSLVEGYFIAEIQ